MDELDDSRSLTRARMVLASIGIPLAGSVVSDFTIRLLDALDRDLDDTTNIDRAIEYAPTGVFGLPADEPLLGTEPLPSPAATALDAAETAVRRLAQRVIDQQRTAPTVPPLHPSPEQRAALRKAHAARRPERIVRAPADLNSANWHERANATTRLAAAGACEHQDAIRPLLDDTRPEVVAAARSALAQLSGRTDDS